MQVTRLEFLLEFLPGELYTVSLCPPVFDNKKKSSRSRDVPTWKVVTVTQHIVTVSYLIHHVAEVLTFSLSHNAVWALLSSRSNAVLAV